MNELSRNRGQGILMVLRITVEAAAAFFITAALLDYGTASTEIGRRLIQLQPEVAALTLSLAVMALWLAITLIFGRIFCSTLCPLGALMDLVGRMRPRSRVYRYRRPLSTLRLGALTLVLLLLVSRFAFPRHWLLPFGLYASLVDSLVNPRVCAASFIAAAICGVIAAVAFTRGRAICSTLCPVGTLLGIFARRAVFHIDINTDRCTQCRRCADVCKARCIDLNDHVVDMSRCVVCFDCLPECPADAITYTPGRHTLSDPLMMPSSKSTVKPLNDETIS